MERTEKIGSMVILCVASLVALFGGYSSYAPLFLILMVGVGSVPVVAAPIVEVVIEEETEEKPKTAAEIAKKRLPKIILANGEPRGNISADLLSDDDLFDLFVQYKEKFMAIEVDLYKRALYGDDKQGQRNYMVAPLMRVGVVSKEATFYGNFRLAF